MIDLAEDNLNDLIKGHNKVVVQYGAAWCGNCRMIKPKFKRLAEATADAEFVYVDAEKYPGSRKLAEVSNLPTFALFEGGELKGQVVGTKFEKVEELVNASSGN